MKTENKKPLAKSLIYCGVIRFLGSSIFVEFVGTSHPQINILNELLNEGYKVINPFEGVIEYLILRPH